MNHSHIEARTVFALLRGLAKRPLTHPLLAEETQVSPATLRDWLHQLGLTDPIPRCQPKPRSASLRVLTGGRL
jgi:hypothetical protein